MTANFWNTFQPESAYLTQEQRQDLVNSGTVFNITHVSASEEGRFGPTWEFTLEIPGFEVAKVISIRRNPNRDQFANAAASFLRNNPGQSIQAVLSMTRTQNGQLAYNFDTPDNNEMGAEPAEDDLPF